ncbi:MAG: recombinase family protein [Bacteroidota bacterium]|jgi:DNA invertase Pin-like site-specific DNA recombinase
MENYIAYVRTSTGRQLLGLEEQQSRINQFIDSTGDNLIEVVVEQESGKNNNRIKLEYATSLCIKHGYTLLFTKLDRLSREVEFLFTLRNKGVKLRCIDLPELNTLTLGIFGSVAQWERELISNRTKSGLAALKSRGIKLGSPQNLTNEARMRGVETIVKKRCENENWKMARMFIEHFQMKHGYLNYTHISKELNENGYKTRLGCSFSPTSVRRLYLT